MKKSIKRWARKWLITNVISSLLFAGFAAGIPTANALPLEFNPAQLVTPIVKNIEITSHSAVSSNAQLPDTINPANNEKFTINYCVNAPAKLEVGIYKAKGENSSLIVNILSKTALDQAGCALASWDGKNGQGSQIGANGEIVPNGDYFYGIKADGISPNSQGSAYKANWIYVETTQAPANPLKIVDFEVENRIFDPYNDQEAEFTFIINKKANITLTILDEEAEKIATLIDNKSYEKGEYIASWDGEDMYGDIVSQGEYTYKLTARTDEEKASKTGIITVKRGYEQDTTTLDPRLKTVYATKEIFDPGRKEKTNIVFTLTAKADVTVTIYDKDGTKVERIFDEDDLAAGTHLVEWKGEKALNKNGKYTYKIYAKNSKGAEIVEGQIEVAKEEKENRKPDVSKDKANPIPFAPKKGSLTISFNLDKDSTVTIEIRDDRTVLTQIVEEKEMASGAHNIKWDGKDEYGEYLEDGVYGYKIIAENNKGKDVEIGKFSIEDTAEAKRREGGSCGAFYDINEDYKYCDAIKWAENEGVFEGYSNEEFRPNSSINRAEALKVILTAMKIRVLESAGENLGFTDTNRSEWYMSYLKTALAIGVVHGYSDGTFKPYKEISRIEALLILLNTAKVKYNIVIPTNDYDQPYYDVPNNENTRWYLSYAWYAKANSLTDNAYYFYPNSAMTRGEMADMLYRFHKASLDQ